jgi:hypothetical protein
VVEHVDPVGLVPDCHFRPMPLYRSEALCESLAAGRGGPG